MRRGQVRPSCTTSEPPPARTQAHRVRATRATAVAQGRWRRLHRRPAEDREQLQVLRSHDPASPFWCRLANLHQNGEHVGSDGGTYGASASVGKAHDRHATGGLGTDFFPTRKFNLDGLDGLQSYWHDVRRPSRTTVRRQNGGGSVMVWGAFSAKGKSKLAMLAGRQASVQYTYTVSEFLLPYAHLNYGVDFVYQQDNASIHTSKETMQFFEE
ncbi:hypothetical protein JG687_00004714 [Phytophthora cactorum]|uniref:Tc1-like transposase DDE domain-containing protein n=2 Tax=Phytophthora cactorum TaxID=29920 RepID=A0A8T1USF1_9STRA|nr:hypothetical protein JG687_00004714 [Phytophthora cactorum]